MAADRLTIYFPAEASRKLSSIQRRSRLQNGVDVVMAALDCYRELLEVDRKGGSISVKRRSGDSWPYFVDHQFDYPGFQEQAAGSADENQDDAGAIAGRNLVFSKDAVAKLNHIKRLSRYISSADIVRAALASFDELIRIRERGDAILAWDKKGKGFHFSPFAPLDLDRMSLSDTVDDDAEGDPNWGQPVTTPDAQRHLAAIARAPALTD